MTRFDTHLSLIGDWQVIFKTTIAGREIDFCRETMPGDMSRADILAWTERRVAAHNLAGATIERW